MITARRRPALNCCSRSGSSFADFLRSSRILLTWLDCLASGSASASLPPRAAGWAYCRLEGGFSVAIEVKGGHRLR